MDNRIVQLPSPKKKLSLIENMDEAIKAILAGVHPPFVEEILVRGGLSKERARTIVLWGKRAKMLKAFPI